MVKSYEFRIKPRRTDYLLLLINKYVGPCLGITEYADRILVHFESPLPPEKEEELKRLVNQDPVPAEELHYSKPSIATMVEKEIGVRPFTRKNRDREVVLMFERKLTDKEKTKLATLMETIVKNLDAYTE